MKDAFRKIAHDRCKIFTKDRFMSDVHIFARDRFMSDLKAFTSVSDVKDALLSTPRSRL